MKESKLIRIIRRFDKTEQKAFDKFIRSPFFYEGRRSEEMIQLFRLVIKAGPDFPANKLDREYLYRKLYPGKPPVKGKLEKLASELTKLAQDFIAVQYSREINDPDLRNLTLARFYREKGMEQQFQKTTNRVEQSLVKKQIQDKSFFHHRFLLEMEKVWFESTANDRTVDLNLPNASRALDVYYLVTKLELTIWLQSQNVNVRLELDQAMAFLDNMLQEMESMAHLNIPVLQVYRQAYWLLKKYQGDNHQDFTRLSELLNQYEKQIDPQQVKALQTLLRIYAVGQYNRGNDQYLSEAFLLYKKHLEAGYLYYDGNLFPGTVRNVVMLGLRFEEFDWVQNFLEDHKNRITGTQYPMDVYQFNYANLFFTLKQYDKALDLLSGNYEDLYYKIAARRLEIKAFYELESPLLHPRIEAFKVHIFRIAKNQLPDKHRLANNDFVDILKQILNPGTLKNAQRINKLQQKIETKNVLAEKDWLLEKLELLY